MCDLPDTFQMFYNLEKSVQFKTQLTAGLVSSETFYMCYWQHIANSAITTIYHPCDVAHPVVACVVSKSLVKWQRVNNHLRPDLLKNMCKLMVHAKKCAN